MMNQMVNEDGLWEVPTLVDIDKHIITASRGDAVAADRYLHCSTTMEG